MARLVLVHGAFGGTWCWDRVVPELAAAGHAVETVTLPGARGDDTPVAEVSLDAYAERICETLAGGPPAILAGHSMGGMAITQAAARSPEHVQALAYVAAFLPQDGQSLGDLVALPEGAGDQVQANLVVQDDSPVAILPAAAAPEVLFHCCADADARWAAGMLVAQPLAPFGQPMRVPAESAAAFAALPRAYISCLQDRAILPALQRRMCETAGCDPVIEIDTDHSPWLSRTNELVGALNRIGGGV
ncbi:MAG TPA: alpha/beta fold hydrolase [Solirubrobacteraceae bacterium]|nr:alpha/beta fold hydrolase [Solirubrobacteraceae bacterium]